MEQIFGVARVRNIEHMLAQVPFLHDVLIYKQKYVKKKKCGMLI